LRCCCWCSDWNYAVMPIRCELPVLLPLLLHCWCVHCCPLFMLRVLFLCCNCSTTTWLIRKTIRGNSYSMH
jgi:hypothetical protein